MSRRMRRSCWMPPLKPLGCHWPPLSTRSITALSPDITSKPASPWMVSAASRRPSLPDAGSSLMRPVPPDHVVVAGLAGHGVAGGVALHVVVARAAEHHVVAILAVHHVVAALAVQLIAAGGSGSGGLAGHADVVEPEGAPGRGVEAVVLPGPAGQRADNRGVVAGDGVEVAAQIVPGVAAEDGVGAVEAAIGRASGVVAGGPAGAANQVVLAGVAEDVVGAGVALGEVIAVAAVDAVIAALAVQHVVAVLAAQQIIAAGVRVGRVVHRGHIEQADAAPDHAIGAVAKAVGNPAAGHPAGGRCWHCRRPARRSRRPG